MDTCLQTIASSKPETANRLNVIKTLVMPTCNRVESTSRSLRTFIENSLKFDLQCDYVVYDDSLSPEVREGYRTMLKRLQGELGVPILYAGLEEKVCFLKRLLSGGDIPPDVAKFALFDVHRHGASTLGANRNAVMLDNVGRGLVTVDDDTFCKISRVPGANEEIEFVPGDLYSVSDPCEFESYRDRDELLANLRYSDTAFLEIHERVLGKTAEELKGTTNGTNSGGGKVLISFNGLAGDCTWASFASYVYFFVTGPALARLATSTAKYEAARGSREIMRVSRRIFISPVAAAPGAFFGMDNRELLPPFMPLGGAEDTFYWEMKRKCFSEHFFAHLPWALLHQPPVVRQFHPADIRRSRQGFDFYSIVKAFLRSLTPPVEFDVPVADRLAWMAEQFEELSARRALDFECAVRSMLKAEVARTKERLEQKLVEIPDSCRPWREDLEHCLREYWSIDDPNIAIPVDFMFRGGREESLKLGRTLLADYGRLLRVWPSMMQKAAELWKTGIRLAKPV
jgi:hypothetical protein